MVQSQENKQSSFEIPFEIRLRFEYCKFHSILVLNFKYFFFWFRFFVRLFPTTTKMSGEEDEKELELKDLIIQTLETNGILAKIKVIFHFLFVGVPFYMNKANFKFYL